MATRRRTVRRRNPAAHWERLTKAAELPLLSASDVGALSDNELSQLWPVYNDAMRAVLDGAKPTRGTDPEYDAEWDKVLSRLDESRARIPWEQHRRGWAKIEAKRAEKAARAVARDAKKSLVTSSYFARIPTLGYRILFPDRTGKEVVFKVTGLAAGNDPQNDQYVAALIADGVRDQRQHRGDWAVLEEVGGDDAALVSVGKGTKRNPRRRTATRRRNGAVYATGPVIEAALVNAKKAVTIMSKDDVALDLLRPVAEARTALNTMVLTRRRLKKTGTGFSVNYASYNEIVAVFRAVASHLPPSSKAKALLLAIPVSRTH
jgi:hypothetical protein